jgi:hypothetical protein
MLINKASGLKCDADGNLNPEQYHLDLVAHRGTAFGDGSLRFFLGGLASVVRDLHGPNEQFGIAYAEKSIWDSQDRIDSFLKRLGRTLEAARKKKMNRGMFGGPDWSKVDKVDHCVALGWCRSIRIGDMLMPPLCWFTMPALFDLLRICKPPVVPLNSDLEAFRQRIVRLGLVPPKQGKIKWVKRKDENTIEFG